MGDKKYDWSVLPTVSWRVLLFMLKQCPALKEKMLPSQEMALWCHYCNKFHNFIMYYSESECNFDYNDQRWQGFILWCESSSYITLITATNCLLVQCVHAWKIQKKYHICIILCENSVKKGTLYNHWINLGNNYCNFGRKSFWIRGSAACSTGLLRRQ